MKHVAISRRTLLRGAGVSLGLPWLEAMMPSRASAASVTAKSPVRLAVLYMPNGVNVNGWAMEGKGRDFSLSPTLTPLADFKDRILVLDNLWNAATKGGDGHYCKEACILTCTTIKKTPGADLCNGVSMDQLAAQRAGEQTPLASLELGVTPVATGIDAAVGYTRLYGAHIAWSSPTTPVARETTPRAAFERLFSAYQTPKGNAVKMESLLLDQVLSDGKKLRTQVGHQDQLRLDEYFSTIRSLEDRVQRAGNHKQGDWKARAKIDPNAVPVDGPHNHAEHVRLMLDIIATAFQSDTTRVSTFMFGNAVSNVSFRFLEGVSSSHHETSHHAGDAEKLRQYQLINRWHVEQYAYLLRKLDSMKEEESTVLNNAMVLFGSALRDGNAHSPHNLPLVLAGKAGGRIDSGQHLVYSEDSPLANLYVSMLDAFGTPVERFADSTGYLPGILREKEST